MKNNANQSSIYVEKKTRVPAKKFFMTVITIFIVLGCAAVIGVFNTLVNNEPVSALVMVVVAVGFLIIGFGCYKSLFKPKKGSLVLTDKGLCGYYGVPGNTTYIEIPAKEIQQVIVYYKGDWSISVSDRKLLYHFYNIENVQEFIQGFKTLFEMLEKEDAIDQSRVVATERQRKEQRGSWKAKAVIIAIALSLALLYVSCMNGSSSSKDGFIGSDGEFHEYIPEFGDDVNSWMKENW